MNADERTRVVLGALVAGASVEAALGHVGAKDLASARLQPRAVQALLEVCPAEALPRCAEIALTALRPRPSAPRETSHPTGLFFGSLMVIAVGAVIRTWVVPVFVEFPGTGPMTLSGASTVLAILAMLLGLLGVAMASRGLGARALVDTLVLSLVSIDRDVLKKVGLPIPRRRGDAAGLDALLGWLAAATVAGVEPKKLLTRIPTPALGQASAQRLWSAARESPRAFSAIVDWAKKEPPEVRNVAVRLAGEDDVDTLLRVRRVALTIDRTNELGAAVSAVGFALLVAATYLIVEPVMTGVARLAGGI